MCLYLTHKQLLLLQAEKQSLKLDQLVVVQAFPLLIPIHFLPIFQVIFVIPLLPVLNLSLITVFLDFIPSPMLILVLVLLWVFILHDFVLIFEQEGFNLIGLEVILPEQD